MTEPTTIRTKTFEARPDDLFQVHLRRYLRQRWWFLLFLVGLVIFVLSQGVHPASLTFAFILLSFPTVILGYFWLVSRTRSGRSFRTPRHFEFTPDTVTCVLTDQQKASVPIPELHHIEFYPGFMLLYVRRNLFFFVPDHAFESPDHRETVIQWLTSAGLPSSGKR